MGTKPLQQTQGLNVPRDEVLDSCSYERRAKAPNPVDMSLVGIAGCDPELPPRSKPVTPHGPTAWIEIKLREGKKRQIRHMTAAMGLPTLRLVRVAIGRVRLGDLEPGQWRDLTPDEINSIKK
jgi:pseudouridine synthase